jgi:RNA polymerase sigma-70 factor (ECF subfamily)
VALRTAYDELPDGELVSAVLAREPAAWPTFFAKYERLVVACVRRALRRYGAAHGEEDIEDLVSQTAFNLVKDDYKKLRTFDASRGYKLSSWVGLIATNTALDALRRRGPTDVWSAASLDDTDPVLPTLTTADRGPADLLAQKDEIRLVKQAIEELSESDRLFLEYYYVEELEPEEIARLMGISLNTVYSRKNKIREKLARFVNAGNDDSASGNGDVPDGKASVSETKHTSHRKEPPKRA